GGEIGAAVGEIVQAEKIAARLSEGVNEPRVGRDVAMSRRLLRQLSPRRVEQGKHRPQGRTKTLGQNFKYQSLAGRGLETEPILVSRREHAAGASGDAHRCGFALSVVRLLFERLGPRVDTDAFRIRQAVLR